MSPGMCLLVYPAKDMEAAKKLFQAVLGVEAATFDLSPALAEFAARGYARLGRVVSEEALAALGARVDDLMSARVRHEGLFFQRDSPTGRYEDLEFRSFLRSYQHACLRMGKRAATAQVDAERAHLWHASHPARGS